MAELEQGVRRDIAYNKWLAVKRWKQSKKEDEQILREEGASEETIQKLREYDWEMFKQERRFLERQTPMAMHSGRERMQREEIYDEKELLEAIDHEALYEVVKSLDSVSREILVLKLQQYNTAEIARKLGITEKAVYRRMDRIKEKIKKIVE